MAKEFISQAEVLREMRALEGASRGSRMDQIVTKFNQTGIEKNTRASQEWFLSNLRKLKGLEPNSLLRSRRRQVGNMLPRNDDRLIGNMFMYVYDAKHKKTLPYWDRFPLVIPMEKYKDGILGMNMHYLPPRVRAQLFNRLLGRISDNNFDQKTRLILSYNILNSTRRYSFFKPTIKRYLNSQIRSNIIKIPSDEWEMAIFLPTEQFVGASKLKVWADSRKKWGG